MKFRVCTKCGTRQALIQFNYIKRDSGLRSSHCRDCTKRASKRAYRKRRHYYIQENRRLRDKRKRRALEYIREYLLSHPCVDCGIEDWVVLQFDHVTGTKRLAIAVMLSAGSSVDEIKKEIKKCVVRCANCHQAKTAKEQGYYMHKMRLQDTSR